MKRPWGGQVEPSNDEEQPDYDPTNPLCPGNTRANGALTPKYEKTFAFNNDFPAMLEDAPNPPENEDELFLMAGAQGTCRVMCFHPKSNVTIALMKVDEIKEVIKQWINEMLELGKKWTWIQIFENRGALMGCSNAHPHCQIWASSFLPNEPRIKDKHLKEYYDQHKVPLLYKYMKRELAKKERLVLQTHHWIVVVPYWAVWPYETMVLPTRRVSRMQDLTDEEQESLAVIMKVLCTKYDNLFKCSFPYSMGWHGAPTGPNAPEDCSHWSFHGIYYPPLLRSATIKKHMVGYELLAQAQRDLTPEQAAEKLRDVPLNHYKYPETSLTYEDVTQYI
ncbi:probable galactose-1-phosphate uridylyltransferase isoform X2 [Copidosoma floridanum]|nr:probable galactose-1-phosphate uridylyltransferase isoform X2 [Copidosoma floridanum]XP_014219472.1 probable galactose-1-phosphate uridylyltransferase isoform X2 [Copidosoma floridanum]